jgi:serine/threonine protein kinase
VRIADFGLACMMGPAKTLAVSKVTNPRWSAPEVIRDSSVSTSADVFSYGIVMWELLTWCQPYEDMMSVQARGPSCERCAFVSGGFTRLMDPEQRG